MPLLPMAVHVSLVPVLQTNSDSLSRPYATLISLNVGSLQCRMPGCDWASRIWDTDHKTTMHGIPEALIHERTQFGKPGKYICGEKDGGLANQRWLDFLRYVTIRHCANVEEKKSPCTFIGCKYDGGNGFRRKDKLKNHQAKAFKAYLVPGQALQSIKPYQH